MRFVVPRDDADERMPVLLYLPVLLGAPESQVRRLLRVLLVLGSGLPAEADRATLLLTPPQPTGRISRAVLGK
jgi:hypothetical protein